MSALAVTGLNQSYGGSHTLWDVDLAVPAVASRQTVSSVLMARRSSMAR